jgi:hypothetical protein
MLAARQQIYDQDARTISANQAGTQLGQVAETPDGRVFQYALAGASNLAAGKITVAPATTANHITQTGVATLVGDTNVTFTIGATAAAADLYASGYLGVTVGPGQNLYGIVGNSSVSASGGSITVSLSEPITVATTTSSKFTLFPHSMKSTVLSNGSSVAEQVTGAPNVAVTAAYYYWTQVGGYAPVLSDGAITKNAGAIASASVAGAVAIEATTTVTNRVGFAPELTVTTAYWPIVLTLVQ